MIPPCKILLISILLVIGCGSQQKAIQRSRINIAVMDFEARSNVQVSEAQSLRDMFISLLRQNGRFNLIDRKQLAAAMESHGLQSSRESDLAKAGRILAVRKMLFGSVGKLGKSVYVINVKITDVESATVDGSVSKSVEGDLKDFKTDYLESIVEEIARSIDSKHD